MSRLHLLLIAAFAALAHADPSPTMPASVADRALLTASLISPQNISTVEIKEVTLPPHLTAGVHLHPCPVVGVIKTGKILFQIEGESAQHLGPGDAFYEPAHPRVLHFDSEGATPASFTAFYLLAANQHELIRMLAR